MANVYLTVWDSAGEVALGDPVQFIVAVIDGARSAVITGSGRKRKRVRLLADADCFLKYGVPTVTATDGTDSMPLGADNPEYIDMEVGHELHAISRA